MSKLIYVPKRGFLVEEESEEEGESLD